MSSLVGDAEAISQQIPPETAFGCVLILVIIGLALLLLLFFTLRHDIRSNPSI
ncbi:hypothetical protein FXV91_09640 [Methanosarcina sp. DH2]|uniref:hypothetical protein n=1 Tax=unclassified Methanosarcina TaxID=2644672 RepID=UPI001E52E02C|nr:MULTISPECIES: hypothetical protein [unclassified Methanosarcina]MCC4770440.1 hypothetical protein [Methanosarcina sp. DH2]MDY9925255.1 hypothetical protein [Methanosarcina sp.]